MAIYCTNKRDIYNISVLLIVMYLNPWVQNHFVHWMSAAKALLFLMELKAAAVDGGRKRLPNNKDDWREDDPKGEALKAE